VAELLNGTAGLSAVSRTCINDLSVVWGWVAITSEADN
jgi:hypothetical protein